jgi:hypothetical protein
MDTHGTIVRRIRQEPFLRDPLRSILTRVARHQPGERADILLFASGRSGSTWLMEVIAAEPGMRFVNEPLHPRAWGRAGLPEGPPDGRAKLLHIPKDSEQPLKTYLQDHRATRIYGPYNILSNDFNFRTNRRILKILNAPLSMEIDALCPGYKVIYLMRHPIPTAMSLMKSARISLREPATHLDDTAFVQRRIDPHTEERLRAFRENGSDLQRWVLDWCLNNFRPLRAIMNGRLDRWLILSYEELLLIPEATVDLLARQLDLRSPERLLARIRTPSASTASARVADLRNRDPRSRVIRWRSKVGEEEERRAFEVLDAFGLDAYEFGQPVARRRYLHSADAVEAAVLRPQGRST